jgi:glucose dehydrogenase
MGRGSLGVGLALCAFVSGCAGGQIPVVKPGEWPVYARDPGGMRHSPLTQVNRDNDYVMAFSLSRGRK